MCTCVQVHMYVCLAPFIQLDVYEIYSRKHLSWDHFLTHTHFPPHPPAPGGGCFLLIKHYLAQSSHEHLLLCNCTIIMVLKLNNGLRL